MNHFIKNVERYLRIVAFSVTTLAAGLCYGHDWPVHMAITASAFTNSAGLQEHGLWLRINEIAKIVQPRNSRTSTASIPASRIAVIPKSVSS
jgi:hypothetical protein